MLKYNSEVVDAAKSNPENITEDGIEDAFDVCIVVLIVGERAEICNEVGQNIRILVGRHLETSGD